MVPARSACWLGAVVLLLGVLLAHWMLTSWWHVQDAYWWILVVLGAWYACVVLVQLALGHRRSCLWRRSLRWFLGPIGALIDPFDLDG